MTHSDDRLDDFRPDIPSPARVYNYVLGGKDHYPADRVVGEDLIAALPNVRTAARQNREFLGRATRYLAEAGIRQFLDIGTGLPTYGQVHEIVQDVTPDGRVVYIDNDPVVLAHGREMLHGVDNAIILRHDMRDPKEILDDPALRRLFDFTQPIALLLVAVLHFLSDEEDPYGLVRRYIDALPSGSHVVISHITQDHTEGLEETIAEKYRTSSSAYARRWPQVAAFFDGLELVEPGLVWTPLWRPKPGTTPPADPSRSICYGGVARKP